MSQTECDIVFETSQLLVATLRWHEEDIYIVLHRGTHHTVSAYTALHVAVNFAQYANETFDFDGVVEKIMNNQDVSAWIPIHDFLLQKMQHPAFAHDYWNTMLPTSKAEVKRAVKDVQDGR